MAVSKLSQIATTTTAPASTDQFVGVQSGTTDVLFKTSQIVGGTSGTLQYNNSGVFGGDPDFFSNGGGRIYTSVGGVNHTAMDYQGFRAVVNDDYGYSFWNIDVLAGGLKTCMTSPTSGVISFDTTSAGNAGATITSLGAAIVDATGKTVVLYTGPNSVDSLPTLFNFNYAGASSNAVQTALVWNGEIMLCDAFNSNPGVQNWWNVNQIVTMNTAGFHLPHNFEMGWASGAVYNGLDVGIGRFTSGTLQVNNGTSGTSADLTVRLLYTSTFTVTGLPSITTKGARAFVTDATATSFMSTVTGGGTVNVPVVYDGTNWKIG